MVDFTSNLNTSTSGLPNLLKKTIDVIINASPLTLYFIGNQKKWKGTQHQQPVKVTANTQGIAFDGLDKFSTTAVSNFINLTFNPTGREIPIVLSQIEVDLNESNQTQSLLKRRLQSDAHDLANDIAGDLVNPTATQSGKKFFSILDGSDDGTVTSSYGGQSRTTYTGLKGTVTSSVGTLTTAKMRTQFNAQSHGHRRPNLIVTDKVTWGYYEALLTATLQTTLIQRDLTGYDYFMADGSLKGAQAKYVANQGFAALTWNGIPVVADEKIPAGYMYFLNKESWGFYGLPSAMEGAKSIGFDGPIDGVYGDGKYPAPKTWGFTYLPMQRPIDQYGLVGHLLLVGQLICEESRINGYMSGITS